MGRNREPKNPKTCHERALGLLAVRPRSRREMETRLLTLAAYFAHPEFAGRLIRKRFAELQGKQRWQSRQTQ